MEFHWILSGGLERLGGPTRLEGEAEEADLSKFGRITILEFWQNSHFEVLEKAGEVAGAPEIWESLNGEVTKMPICQMAKFGNVCLPASCLSPASFASPAGENLPKPTCHLQGGVKPLSNTIRPPLTMTVRPSAIPLTVTVRPSPRTETHPPQHLLLGTAQRIGHKN